MVTRTMSEIPDLVQLASDIVTSWCQEVQQELTQSLTGDVILTEHQLIVTSNGVMELLGKYYVRNFGRSSFATAWMGPTHFAL